MSNNSNCDYCDYCNYCNYCNSCDYCDSCGYCGYCNSCDYCDSCNYCKSCKYCVNLKMTEYNYFCYAEEYNDKDSFQQKRYRIFNQEVSKDEYNEIEKIRMEIEIDDSEPPNTRYKTAFVRAWNKLPGSEKKKVTSLKWFDKDAFKKYYWVDVEENIEELTLEQVCKELGRDVKIIKG